LKAAKTQKTGENKENGQKSESVENISIREDKNKEVYVSQASLSNMKIKYFAVKGIDVPEKEI
jgi:hypothetical protein